MGHWRNHVRRRHQAQPGTAPVVGLPRLGPVTALPVFGREREIVSIIDALRQGPVNVVGPVGAGKTELLHEVARRLTADGRRMADVLCRPGETLDAVIARAE